MELPSLASGATTSGIPAWKSRTLNHYFAITMDLKNQIRTTRPETWRETNGKENRDWQRRASRILPQIPPKTPLFPSLS
jgi:hypothetical protein